MKFYGNKFVIDHMWYGKTGFVVYQDKVTKKIKTYISTSQYGDVDGDIIHILDWGYTFNEDASKALFPHIDFDHNYVDEYIRNNAELFV
jgi:hypothetical protein